MTLFKILVTCLIFTYSGKCDYLKGTLDTTKSKEEWVFLARFCFISEIGTFAFKVNYPRLFTNAKILLYFDEPHQWASVYNNDDKTCLEKTSDPYINRGRNQEIDLNPLANSGCKYTTDPRNGADSIECAGLRSFISVRERWWYIAVSNCGEDKGIYMDFQVNLTNGAHPSDFFHFQFSADEFGILETDIAFLVLCTALAVATIICAVLLHQKKYLHSTYKLYMASLYVKIFSLLFLTIAYGTFANDGLLEKQYILACIGRFLGVIAHLIFVVMLILLAKGYTVTRGKLRFHSVVVLVVFTTIYSFTILLLYIVEFTLFDPAQVLYIYDFYYGIGLILLPILGLLWLIYAVFFTLKHYPEKWKYYIPFVILYGAWFLTLPVIVIASNLLIPQYMKEKVVNAVEMGVSFIGYVCFLLLTLPCCVNKVFPYHVKTNKIDIIDDAPHENVNGHGGDAYIVSDTAPSTLYTVSTEKVTITNKTQNGTITANHTGPNLSAMFLVQNAHSPPKEPKERRFSPYPIDGNDEELEIKDKKNEERDKRERRYKKWEKRYEETRYNERDKENEEKKKRYDEKKKRYEESEKTLEEREKRYTEKYEGNDEKFKENDENEEEKQKACLKREKSQKRREKREEEERELIYEKEDEEKEKTYEKRHHKKRDKREEESHQVNEQNDTEKETSYINKEEILLKKRKQTEERKEKINEGKDEEKVEANENKEKALLKKRRQRDKEREQIPAVKGTEKDSTYGNEEKVLLKKRKQKDGGKEQVCEEKDGEQEKVHVNRGKKHKKREPRDDEKEPIYQEDEKLHIRMEKRKKKREQREGEENVNDHENTYVNREKRHNRKKKKVQEHEKINDENNDKQEFKFAGSSLPPL